MTAATDERAVAERRSSRRRLIFGLVLAAALPLLCIGLVMNDYLKSRHQADVRARLLIDAVEKQLRDRLFLVAGELDAAAAAATRADPVPARPLPIPLYDLQLRAAAPAATSGLALGPPQRVDGHWRVPVTRAVGGGRQVGAMVDASLFTDVVAGYSLATGDMLNLIHTDRVLLARSSDPQRYIGVRLDDIPLFRQGAHAGPGGSYDERTVLDGVDRHLVYRRLPDLPLIIVAGIALAPMYAGWMAFAAAALGLSLLLALSWAWLLRRFDRAQRHQGELIARLDSSERRLQQAHALARMGEWCWCMDDGQVQWSQESYRIFGREPDDKPLDVESVFALIHPDDVPRLREFAAELVADGPPVEAEFRVLRPDGAIRYVQARGELQVDADGRRCVRGVQQDVTALAEARERLRAAEARYRFLFEHNPLPMWVFDLETLRFLAVNQTAIDKYGYSRAEFLARTFMDIRPAEDVAEAMAYMTADPEPDDRGKLWRHQLKDGSLIYVNNTKVEVDFDGRRAWLVLVRDISEQVQAEAERERSEQRFRLIARATSDAIWDWDIVTGDLWWSESFYALFGYGHDEMPPTIQGWEALVHPDDRERVVSGLERAIGSNVSEWSDSYRFRRKDGSYAQVADRGFLLRVDGRAVRAAGGMLDLTQKHQDESDLRLLRRAVESTGNGIVIADAQQRDYPVVYVNPGFQNITGYHPQEMLGRNCRVLQRDDREQPGIESLRLALSEGDEAQVLLRNYRADGSLFWNEFHMAPVRDDRGTLTHFIGVLNDVTERQQYQEQLAHRATHDELTGLPNRQLLQDRLQQAILNAARYGRAAGVIFVDLDDFKLVNDTLGHSAGDCALRTVAQRLRGVIRNTDTVGRFGGDEFVVVLTEQADADGMHLVIDRITATLSAPMEIAGVNHTLTPSIGWCSYPEAGSDAETLLMHADMAMYQAKRGGRNRAVAYRAEFEAAVSQRLRLSGELREGLRLEQFALVFQPMFDLHGRVVALEALVRWQHPERGLLLPEEFIGVCEESGLIVELGRRVIREAARHHRLLEDSGLRGLRIAVNVSAAQFGQDLAADVEAALREHPLPPGLLEIEITESVIMQDPVRAIAVMQRLTTLGVSFAIDDFGTGHSSLAYLKQLPINRLKIDRSFVTDLTIDPDDATICASIIGLAHSLALTTVAEGVETQEQLDWLHTRGCDEIQGYLLGRPQPFASLLAVLLEAQSRAGKETSATA